MDDKRLQEIKDCLLPYGEEHLTDEEHDWSEVTTELITAYENQGELLQLALGNVDKLNEELGWVQYELKSCKSLAKLERENLLERNTDLISERKKSQDEADSIAQSMVNLRNQLDASHAVNDVYRNMVKVLELTIELLSTNGEE